MDFMNDVVAIFHDEIKGRGLKAKKKINAGQQVLLEPCFATAVKQSCVTTVCAHCMAEAGSLTQVVRSINLQKCQTCEKIYYCSESCRQADKCFHDLECLWLKPSTKIPTVTARLVGRALIRMQKQESWSPLSLFKGNPSLISKEDSNHNAKTIVEIYNYIPSSFIPGIGIAHDLISAINMNATFITGYDLSPLAVGIFPTFSLINHSCNPNCSVSFPLGNSLRLYSLVDINPGDEITISYIDVAYPKSMRHEGLQVYQMNCMCDRCTSSEEASMACLDKNATSELVIKHIKKLEGEILSNNGEESTFDRISKVERELSLLFPPENIIWSCFYKWIAVMIRENNCSKSAGHYKERILDNIKKTYGTLSRNYFTECLFFCFYQFIWPDFWLRSYYCYDFSHTAIAIYGDKEPFIKSLLTIFNLIPQ